MPTTVNTPPSQDYSQSTMAEGYKGFFEYIQSHSSELLGYLITVADSIDADISYVFERVYDGQCYGLTNLFIKAYFNSSQTEKLAPSYMNLDELAESMQALTKFSPEYDNLAEEDQEDQLAPELQKLTNFIAQLFKAQYASPQTREFIQELPSLNLQIARVFEHTMNENDLEIVFNKLACTQYPMAIMLGANNHTIGCIFDNGQFIFFDSNDIHYYRTVEDIKTLSHLVANALLLVPGIPETISMTCLTHTNEKQLLPDYAALYQGLSKTVFDGPLEPESLHRWDNLEQSIYIENATRSSRSEERFNRLFSYQLHILQDDNYQYYASLLDIHLSSLKGEHDVTVSCIWRLIRELKYSYKLSDSMMKQVRDSLLTRYIEEIMRVVILNNIPNDDPEYLLICSDTIIKLASESSLKAKLEESVQQYKAIINNPTLMESNQKTNAIDDFFTTVKPIQDKASSSSSTTKPVSKSKTNIKPSPSFLSKMTYSSYRSSRYRSSRDWDKQKKTRATLCLEGASELENSIPAYIDDLTKMQQQGNSLKYCFYELEQLHKRFISNHQPGMNFWVLSVHSLIHSILKTIPSSSLSLSFYDDALSFCIKYRWDHTFKMILNQFFSSEDSASSTSDIDAINIDKFNFLMRCTDTLKLIIKHDRNLMLLEFNHYIPTAIEILSQQLQQENGHKRFHNSELLTIIIDSNAIKVATLLLPLPIFDRLLRGRVTPLEYTIDNSSEEMLQLIISHYGVDTRSRNNWSGLHVAVSTGKGKMVDVLLARGAPLGVLAYPFDETAKEMAHRYDYPKLAEKLEEAESQCQKSESEAQVLSISLPTS